MKKHQKHTSLVRRKIKNYAPTEISILGTKCSVIAKLVQKIAHFDPTSLKIGYLDASHNEAYVPPSFDSYTQQTHGHIKIHRIEPNNQYQKRIQFSAYDLLFINGNHFEGEQQILILDPSKEASIQKRLSQINSIVCIVKTDPSMDYFPCLQEKFPTISSIPTYTLSDIEAIYQEISSLINTKTPPIQGLILAGGKSKRMGRDKTQLNYHGKPQRTYLEDLLQSKGVAPYISVAEPPKIATPNYIVDTYLNLGPFGGICSAFQYNPNVAWLVVAADVPFVNSTLIQQLITHRNPSKFATTIKGKTREFMEPLITIYEPKAYSQLLQFLAMGYACPKKMLINNDVEVIEVDDLYVTNVNTPEEFTNALNKLNKNA
ncbi:NTP transferase domain-containing protein [Flavobacteriaceae bacterium F08102]|nr:NTP transferase domain-containing protein [Flavobacteriaceae bacterium F08102]